MARARRLLVCGVIAATGAAFSARARAEAGPEARLSYVREAGVAGCPEERELRDAIAARLGRDPFTTNAERLLSVVVSRAPSGIVATLDVTGPRAGHREIASPNGDCRELIDTVAVAAAIAIDPASLARPEVPVPPVAAAVPATPATAPASRPVDASAVAPAPPAREPSPTTLRVALGPEVLFGELPAVTPGIAVAGGVRHRWIDVTLEAGATTSAEQGSARGTVAGALVTGAIVPCGHVSVAFACVLGRVGALRSEGTGVSAPRKSTDAYVSAGARVGVELPLGDRFHVRGHADVVTPLTAFGLRLDDVEVWGAPSLALRIGLALGVGL